MFTLLDCPAGSMGMGYGLGMSANWMRVPPPELLPRLVILLLMDANFLHSLSTSRRGSLASMAVTVLRPRPKGVRGKVLEPRRLDVGSSPADAPVMDGSHGIQHFLGLFTLIDYLHDVPANTF